MSDLLEVRKSADDLSAEDKAGLIAHLLASLPNPPLGPKDHEIDRREKEMDEGSVTPISHTDFLDQIGRA
jgi:hypothetical protein